MDLNISLGGQTGLRVLRRRFDPLPLGRVLGPCWANFRTFSRFVRIFFAFLAYLCSKSRFEVIFLDFSWIWGRFLEDCSTIFRIILEKGDFVKSVVLLWGNYSF